MKPGMKTRCTVKTISQLGILLTALDGSRGIVPKEYAEAFRDVCAEWSVGDMVNVFVANDMKYGMQVMAPYRGGGSEVILPSKPADAEILPFPSVLTEAGKEQAEDGRHDWRETGESGPETRGAKGRIDVAFDRARIKREHPEGIQTHVIPAFVQSVVWGGRGWMVQLSKSPLRQDPAIHDSYEIVYNGRPYRFSRQVSVWVSAPERSGRNGWIVPVKAGSFQINGSDVPAFFLVSEFTGDQLRMIAPEFDHSAIKPAGYEPGSTGETFFVGFDLLRMLLYGGMRSDRPDPGTGRETPSGGSEESNVIVFADARTALERERERQRLLQLFNRMLHEHPSALEALARYSDDHRRKPAAPFLPYFIKEGIVSPDGIIFDLTVEVLHEFASREPFSPD